jgi:hypothetical protein
VCARCGCASVALCLFDHASIVALPFCTALLFGWPRRCRSLHPTHTEATSTRTDTAQTAAAAHSQRLHTGETARHQPARSSADLIVHLFDRRLASLVVGESARPVATRKEKRNKEKKRKGRGGREPLHHTNRPHPHPQPTRSAAADTDIRTHPRRSITPQCTSRPAVAEAGTTPLGVSPRRLPAAASHSCAATNSRRNSSSSSYPHTDKRARSHE